MRRGQWEEAKRLLLAQGEVPDELKPELGPYVDAIADPAQRPAMVAKLRAVDPKVARQVDLVQPYLQLGQTDLVYQIIDDTLDEDRLAWVHTLNLLHLWSPDARRFRSDPRFAELAQRIGLVDYWKQYGYPDGCRAGTGDRALVCAS